MAHVRKTTKPIDSSNAANSTSGAAMNFEFGLLRVTSSDLDEFAKAGWFARDIARPSRGRLFLTLMMMRLLFTRSFSWLG